MNAKRGDTLELPDEKIEFETLVINKPITLIGRPGTTFIINGGPIIVNFSGSRLEENINNSFSHIL